MRVGAYRHVRAAQLAALQLPTVGMATAIDLGDMRSPHGGIHPRLKQEVGRRLALTARAVQFLEPHVGYEGPRLLGVQLQQHEPACSEDDDEHLGSHLARGKEGPGGTAPGTRARPNGGSAPGPTSALLTFAPSSALGLHLAGTAGCHDCCLVMPPSKPWFAAFDVQAPNGTWLPASDATVRRNTVLVRSPVPISGVRAGWTGMPDCLLYNGNGGPHDHAGLPAPPFRHCLYGDNGLPAWDWLSDCNPTAVTDVQPPVPASAHADEDVQPPPMPASTPGGSLPALSAPPSAKLTRALASSDTSSLLLGQTRIVDVPPDAFTSGQALQTGVPKKGASWFMRQVIACRGGEWLVDSVELSLRYRAAPPSTTAASAAEQAAAAAAAAREAAAPATLTITLFNSDSKRVATVADKVPLGNYSAPTGFSAPVQVSATHLNAACDAGLGGTAHGRLRLQMAIDNHDRPLTVPLDDLHGGFRIRVGWVRASA